MGIVAAVIVFGLLIFFHELGHFIVAKCSGVYVERFSIGFGPIILSKKIGETNYALSILPLGGYVKMKGEDPAEEIPQELRARSFSHKALLSRVLIVLAGPVFNFLLAVLIFAAVFIVGIPKIMPIVGEIKKDMPAYNILKEGDRIISIDGKSVSTWDEMSELVKVNSDKTLLFVIDRAGKEMIIKIKPVLSETNNIFGEKVKTGLIGISPRGDVVKIRYNLFSSINNAFKKTYEITKLTIIGIIKIIEKVVPANNIGGPIMIFQMAHDTAKAGLTSLLAFTAVISINLAILNLLPIPVLDGGHLLFYFIEALIGKPVSIRVREIGQMIGLFLILALTFFAFYNDIIRIIKS